MQGFSGSGYNQEFGRRGEDLAASHLKEKGFRILERNYRCRLGEVDLIVEKGETLHFVEVKSRASTDAVSPLELVPLKKQRQISRAAQHYLAAKKFQDRPADFAVLIVDWSKGDPSCELIEGAFPLAWGY